MNVAVPGLIDAGPAVEALARGLGGGLWGVVLYGSAARNEATSASDLDLLVVADDLPEKLTGRSRLLRGLLPASLRGRVSLIAKTRSEFETSFPSYYLDIGEDGIVLRDQGRYMEGKLERIREIIGLAGLTRQRVDREFVWRWRDPPAGHWRLDWSGLHGQ